MFEVIINRRDGLPGLSYHHIPTNKIGDFFASETISKWMVDGAEASVTNLVESMVGPDLFSERQCP